MKVTAWVLNNCKFAFSQEGWSILAYPSVSSRRIISDFSSTLDLKGTEVMPTDELHITIRYWKDKGTKKDEIIEWLNKNIKPIEIKCSSKGMKMLGESALTITWDSPKLISLQKKIDNAIIEMGVPPSEYPAFIAHTTLANEAAGREMGKPDIDAIFNKIKFKHGDTVLWESE